jgi:hypothetical protein
MLYIVTVIDTNLRVRPVRHINHDNTNSSISTSYWQIKLMSDKWYQSVIHNSSI